MVGYLESVSTMHTRGVVIDEKDYIFTLMVVLNESPQNAFALAYDIGNFKKVIGTEDEDSYLLSKTKDAENMLEQQNIIQLRDFLAESYKTQVQAEALNLKDFKFSGQEAVQILNNLLKTRIDDLESSSVRDVVGIIKTLSETGALDTGDSGFSRHFIIVKDKYPAICTTCNHEIDIYPGVGAVCPFCSQHYTWSSEENRFYPSVEHL